jgi:hypothetical protein
MNTEFAPINLQREWNQGRENVVTVVLGIESPAFGKRVEQVNSIGLQEIGSAFLAIVSHDLAFSAVMRPGKTDIRMV